jgi:4-carboxymuconolactone decarboxylase
MRIDLLATDEAKTIAEQVKVAGAMAELNVFRALLRHPPVAKLINDQLIGLLFRGKLDARLRELVILLEEGTTPWPPDGERPR